MNKEKTILGEIERRTKKNERHYRKNDGTTECVISNANINYFDEKEQKWKHTDNSLVEKENCYEGNLGNFQAKLSKEAGKSIIDISGKDMSVSWEYVGVDKPRERKTTPAIRVKKKKNDKENLIAGSEAYYKNVDEGIDIQYIMNGNNVKENIIIRKKQNNYNFKFAYKVKGLELRKSNEEEKLELYSPKTDNVEFSIPAPYMYDAKGARSQEVYYEIEATTEDTYILTVVATTDWINSQERKFPVTIDPQLNVTGKQTTINYLTEHYTATTTTGAPKFECTKVVNDIIDLINNDAEYTVVKIDIDTSNIDIDREDIYLANLKLYPVPNSVSIQVKCTASADNGKSEIMYLTLDSNIAYIPITKLIKNSYDNISLIITLNEKSTVTHSFYSFVTNGPKIEIIYADKERQQSNLKTFSLVGGAEAHINMLTGDKTVTIPDTEDESMGVTVSHVFKYSDDDFCCGNDVRLNIHEKLVKNTDTEIESNYIYTDNLGNKHYLKERFYYLVDGEKVYIEDKESITVLPNGKLIIEASNGDVDIEVYREEASYNGQKATTKLEGVHNVEYLEQRVDEQKQLEEQIENYENALIEYVVYDLDDNIKAEAEKKEASIDDFIDSVENISEKEVILSKNEAKSIESQLEALESQKAAYEYQSTVNFEYLWYLHHSANESNEEHVKAYNSKIIASYVQICGEYECSLPSESALYSESMNLFMNKNCLYFSQMELTQYKSILSQIADLKTTKNNESYPSELLVERSKLYKDQILKLYKEYLLKKEELKLLKQHIPVNYIASDNFIKGFNENGDLVVIYDKHQKYIAFEYEQYSENSVEKYRISRIYDDKEREIKLSYNKETNLLNEIRNSNGEITTYEYYGKTLLKMTYSNDKSISIKDEDSFSLNSEYFSSKIQYVDGKASVIANSTTIDSIAHNNISTETSKDISKTTITYETLETLVLDDTYNGYKYIFDEDGHLIEQWEISKSYVTSANKYTYDSEKENLVASISYPKESCLHQSYTGFAFVEKYLKSFTYDNYDRIETETVEMVDDTISPKVETDAKYTYNENGYVSMVRTKITTEKTNLTTIEYAVQQFEYDKSGNLLCKKSYVEGEELLNGINIEEHIYDKDGFEIKTVSYNSLDPSSRLYKECEVNEDGQTLADFDQSGMFKTIFEGNTAIQPNGARLSCGYSAKDGNSAITMSTENGEENSIQKLYTHGLLTRVISGDDAYDFTYDYKGRVIKVKINGDSYVDYTYTYDENMKSETVVATYNGEKRIAKLNDPMNDDIYHEDGDFFKIYNVHYKDGKINEAALSNENGLENLTRFTYNNQNQVILAERYQTKADKSDIEVTYRESYTYDDDGKLTQRFIDLPQGRPDMTMNYDYDEITKKLKSYTCAGALKVEPMLDCLGRNRGKNVSWNDEKIYSEDITYLKQGDHATVLPLTISYGRKTDNGFVIKENVKYKYDSMGNITKVYENGELVTEYKYDALCRLVRENNKALNKTYTFLYDNKGNIVARKEYPFTLKCDQYLEELLSDNVEYIYSNGRLVSYNGEEIEYDVLGNPTSYKNKALTWRFGKRLMSYGTNTFDYDAESKRTKKNSITYSYDVDGRLITESSDIEYFYDTNSTPLAFAYLGELYYYKKDLLGNIIEILDMAGTTMVKYTYDAWGNHTITDNSGFGLGDINPFRYRGYYYDVETGLYYLQSRYYDPQTGRFINIDDISYLEPETINGINLYCYCFNNPIVYIDPDGHSPKWLDCLLIVGIAAAAIALTIVSCGSASAAIAPLAFAYFGIAANTTLAITTAAAVVTSVGIVAFAAADIQSVITDGRSNYLSFLGGAYDGVKSAFYFASYMFGYAGQFAQPGWGRQTSGPSNAPSKGPQYGQYTKITPQGNDVTIYNGRGQPILRYDHSHSHGGMQPHVHQFDWWKYNGKWRWNGQNGNVYPF